MIAAAAIVVALTGCDRNDRANGTPASPAVDNTVKNKDYDRAKTPIDQSESSTDIKLTADIRKAVIADNRLSAAAKNSKIITDQGMVTLRGPVETQAEKDTLEAIAVTYAGAGHVTNQLEAKKP